MILMAPDQGQAEVGTFAQKRVAQKDYQTPVLIRWN
jgi:hypothetical protein